MSEDKFQTVWVSYSSISDYLHCPRLYFYKHIFREPASDRKISIISPALALGQAVHDALESLSVLPVDKRFETPLHKRLKTSWKKISGDKGGFENSKQEEIYYNKALAMIANAAKNPGPLKKLAVKIQQDLPKYTLSESDNLILCGKIDWLEYVPENDSVHIIDFKTGRATEDEDSLQLPIYLILTKNCQTRKISKASFWYLNRDDKPAEQKLPDYEKSLAEVTKIAKKIKLARQLNKLDCPEGKEGCKYCRPYQQIANGKGQLVGISNFGASIYMLKKQSLKQQSIIL